MIQDLSTKMKNNKEVDVEVHISPKKEQKSMVKIVDESITPDVTIPLGQTFGQTHIELERLKPDAASVVTASTAQGSGQYPNDDVFAANNGPIYDSRGEKLHKSNEIIEQANAKKELPGYEEPLQFTSKYVDVIPKFKESVP